MKLTRELGMQYNNNVQMGCSTTGVHAICSSFFHINALEIFINVDSILYISIVLTVILLIDKNKNMKSLCLPLFYQCE